MYIHYIHLHERFFELVWKRMYAVDRSQFNDTCTLVNGTFKNLKGQKQGQFLLNMYVQMILNNDFVSEQEFYKNMDMSNRWQEGESLAFDDIKSDICQYLDCTHDDNECLNYFGYFDWNLWSSLNAFWAFSTFWEPRTLLQTYLYKDIYALYKMNKDISKGYPMHGIDLWHYLKGKYVDVPQEQNMAVLLSIWDLEFCTEDTQQYNCNLMNINQTEMENFFKDLLGQPKAHGDDAEDFVLIPFCSFGSGPLKACSSFQKSKVAFQDDTCFTYEHPHETTYKEAKFQFVLNMRDNMPKDDKPLSLKVLLHEQGTIPDVLEIDSASQEIYAENDFTKIGITIDSNEVTGTFESMPFKKRNCYLTDEVANYSRMDCLTKHIFQEAWNVCHCTPWTMGELINDTADYCNITGAICFTKITLETLLSLMYYFHMYFQIPFLTIA